MADLFRKFIVFTHPVVHLHLHAKVRRVILKFNTRRSTGFLVRVLPLYLFCELLDFERDLDMLSNYYPSLSPWLVVHHLYIHADSNVSKFTFCEHGLE